MKPRVWILIAAGVVILAVAAVLLRPHARGDSDSAAPAVRTGKAEVGDVRVLLNETGTVEPVRTVVVKSPISGTVRRLLVDEGDTVRVGQGLAVVEPDLSQARSVTELRAAYGSARVTLGQKERDVLKARSLAEGDLVSETELSNFEAEYERAQLDLKSMEEQLRALEQAGVAAQTPAQNVTVNAPAAGVVIALGAEEGEAVLAGTGTLGGGTELIKVADLSRLRIKAAVNEVDIDKVALSLPVKITVDAYPNVEFKGIVHHIAPATRTLPENGVRVFDVEIDVLVPDARLHPGMTANLDIEGAHKEGVLVVPIESVFHKDGRDIVYKMTGTQHAATPVTVGLVDIARAEITDGLQAGDVVALEDPTQPPKPAEGPPR
jgi:HlyD family secretion protein